MAFVRDIVQAGRTLRNSPGVTVTAIVTIALGIGVSAAIFSVVNAVLLQPLPYPEPERLMHFWSDMRNRNVVDFPFPPGDYYDVNRQADLFEAMTAVYTQPRTLLTDGDPEQIIMAGVTPNVFDVLGLGIALGRGFDPSDGAVETAPESPVPTMAVVTHEFWQGRFGGDPGIIGRNLNMGNLQAQIVGVLQPGAELLFPPGTNVDRYPDVWVAQRTDYENGSRINVYLRLVGRLKDGVSQEQAQSQADAIAAELRERFPINETAGVYFRVEPMHEDLVADVRPALLALFGAGAFVLLIACANVANLLLVRSSTRERELAVRMALGGSRSRLVWQMLSESLLLAASGAIVGLTLASAGIDLLLALGPEGLPRVDAVRIDPYVIGFTITVSFLSAALFGIVPAIRASRPDVSEVLRSGRRTAGQRAGHLLRNTVVVTEVALCFVLLIGSGLMLRSYWILQNTNPGFDPDGVLTFSLQRPIPEAEARAAFKRQLRERLESLPGVEAVTAANPLPLDGATANARWGTDAALQDPSSFQQANVHFVLPGYFEAMKTPVLEGRTFEDSDNRDVTLIVIDDVMAAKAFPRESAVGKQLLVRVRSNEPERFEVIGVVRQQRHDTLARPSRETIFFADGLVGHGAAFKWAVRAAGDPSALAALVRDEIRQMDRQAFVSDMEPMTAFIDRAQGPTQFALILIGIFGAIAAILAAIGLYGVISTLVSQRTSEIGVRMTFGATHVSIFQLVIAQGLKLSVGGVALGLIAALALTRFMSSMLIGVEPSDPMTFVVIASSFLLLSAIACWLPARRAASMDPAVCLRKE